MSDDKTTTGSVAWDQAAYNRLAYFALRPELHFVQVADVKPTAQSMPGVTVTFNITSDLAVASTALDESLDVDAVAMSDAEVTVTLAEYGNATNTTAKLRGTSYLAVDPIQANVVGFNAGISHDTLARDVLKGGSNVRYAGQATSRATVIPTDLLTGNNVRRARAELKAASVPTIGGMYVGFMHPDVAYDFRGATGGANWRDPHTYSQPAEIMNGEIGAFEGIRWIETERGPVFADAGSSTTLTDVYRTIVVGRQALAKAWSMAPGFLENPHVVQGPITDKLKRFVPLGWYWLGGFKRFREAAIRGIESASSIGAN